MGIHSRFKVLLAEKELRERRTIRHNDVARETGVSIYTINGFANNTLQEYPRKALEALTAYFGCSIGDLLVDTDDGVSASANVELDQIETPAYTTEELAPLTV